MRISDWSSDVCSSDLSIAELFPEIVKDFTCRKGRGSKQKLQKSAIFDAYSHEKGGQWPPFPSVYNRLAARRSEERRVGKGVSVRVDLGGRRIIKQKNKEALVHKTNTKREHTQR